jgi:hypothetical protein
MEDRNDVDKNNTLKDGKKSKRGRRVKAAVAH